MTDEMTLEPRLTCAARSIYRTARPSALSGLSDRQAKLRISCCLVACAARKAHGVACGVWVETLSSAVRPATTRPTWSGWSVAASRKLRARDLMISSKP